MNRARAWATVLTVAALGCGSSKDAGMGTSGSGGTAAAGGTGAGGAGGSGAGGSAGGSGTGGFASGGTGGSAGPSNAIPELIAKDTGAFALIVAGDTLYATDPEYGIVIKVPKVPNVPNVPTTGGMPTRVAELQGNVFGLVFHPSGLIWASAGDKRYRETGKVMRLRTGQTMPEVFADKVDWPTSVAADEGFVYWGSIGEIKRAPVGGGMPQTLAAAAGQTNVVFGNLVLDGETLYWTDGGTFTTFYEDGQILAMPKAGGTPREVARNQWSPSVIAVDANFVYWTALGTIEENYRDGGVYKKAKSGGQTIPIATRQFEPRAMIVDDRWIYWATADGYLRRVPVAGGPDEVLFKAPTRILSITQDSTHVYFGSERWQFSFNAEPEPWGIWRVTK